MTFPQGTGIFEGCWARGGNRDPDQIPAGSRPNEGKDNPQKREKAGDFARGGDRVTKRRYRISELFRTRAGAGGATAFILSKSTGRWEITGSRKKGAGRGFGGRGRSRYRGGVNESQSGS